MFTLWLHCSLCSLSCVLFQLSNDLPNGQLHGKPCWGPANYCWIVGKWSFRSGCELSWCVWAKRDCVHACTHAHTQHTLSCLTHTHIHRGGKDRKIHQSLSHAEGGSLKETVSFPSLTVALLLSLSSIRLSATPGSPPGHLRAAWPSLVCLPVFSGPAGERGRLLPGQPDGRI